ncbi:MAG: FAD-dependent thymidylate synthase [Lamprobacter sp.]|uniref:FAD-dependent thymidylate synthase n=1 Tax=Lamprobacter sp. TaxID=3100796 RepID=UPI002B25E3E4|nr:FAD-dependent thymidylate synthase [Lamprobacter sp.]MEA3639931.1 FAD-dependent thymidylate synthase [Lamprobacter sp.]
MKAELLASLGSDLMVANAARVSMGKWKDRFDEQDIKLINYLARNGHASPFFHPQIQFRITAPIFVARQWFRSNVGVARNEVSRRYVDDEPKFFIPDEWRSRPDGSIKQGSGNAVPQPIEEKTQANYQNIVEFAQWSYMEAIGDGVAPEQARMILPQSMETQWIETASLMAYARICKLRLDPHAQAEIRDLATQVYGVVAELFPYSWQSLMERNDD